MATVVTFDQARTQEIVDGTAVGGTVDASNNLKLTRRDGTVVTTGPVKGPQGFQGPELPLKPGRIMLYAGAVAPSGWMLCDGTEISRTQYASLFAAIGTAYGSGNGTTTFRIPNFKGRVPVGQDLTQFEFDTIGMSGGAKAVTLTPAQLPAHTHTVLGYANVDDKNFTGNNGRMAAADTFGQNNTTYDKPTLSTGNDGAHNNLQPYLNMNYIIAIGTAGPQGGGVAKTRYFTNTTRGTTAQRDAKYGVPGTAAARVALANQQVTWFNTDLGWKERYYEVTASAGLTAIGLVTGATAGWYPIADGPYIELVALAEVANFIDTYITGWSIYNRKGGTSWFTLNGTDRVDVLKHGRYDLKVFTNQYGGNTATPDYSLHMLASDNATIVKHVGAGVFTKNMNFMTRPHLEGYDMLLTPNQKVGLKLQRGTIPGSDTTMQVHTGGPEVERGRFTVKYTGPPLNDIQT